MTIATRSFAVCIVLLSLPPSGALAEPSDSTTTSRSLSSTLSGDAGIFWQDASSFFTAPLHFSGTEWLQASAVSGGTVLLMTADEEVRRRVGRNTISTLNHDFWDIPTRYGVVNMRMHSVY